MLDPEALAPEQIRPLRRSEYDRMVAMGLFDDERLELLAGILVSMSPQGSLHAAVVQRVFAALFLALEDRAVVRCQSPIALDAHSEPQPDVSIVPLREYLDEHPAQALLVVEVADASLNEDRDVKAALYAAAGVPECWIFDLVDRLVEVHTKPRAVEPATFVHVTKLGTGDVLSPLELSDLRIAVDDVLPGAKPAP